MAESAAAAPTLGGFVGIDLGVNCVVASSTLEDRNALAVNTNDVSGRSTAAAVSYDGKLRHVGVAAEGRAMSAPKQTFTHLPLVLGTSETTAQRVERYLLMFGRQEDGKLGPVEFDGRELSPAPCGPLSVLLRTLSGYAVGNTARPSELCVAVHDYLCEVEVAAVRDALSVAGLGNTSLLRHSDAIACAFAHTSSAALLPEGVNERSVAFVDIGVSHGTVAVVKYARKAGADGAEAAADGAKAEGGDAAEASPAEVAAEFLYRRSDEMLGVQALMGAILGEARSRIEQKHKCTVKMQGKAGKRLSAEAVHTLKHLSMLPDAELALEAFQPEGPDGPEIDVSCAFTRDAFEAAAKDTLEKLREVITEALATAKDGVEGVELVGGGSRVPAVQALVRELAGEAPLRFGLDGSSCVATGAAAWAAGRRVVPAMSAPPEAMSADSLAAVKAEEESIEAVHAKEVQRLDVRNTLESYVYQVRGWISGKNGQLLNPSALEPFLDKVQLWFEDAEYAEEPTSLETYTAKLEEAKAFVQKEGAAFFEKQVKDREEQEKAIEKAAEEERQRRKELGMDADKDDRHMKKEDRLRLAAKNKDEGNDMFKAQKFDDAIRRYKKAIDHVSRPEVLSNFTPEEADEAKKIKVSCHLNSAQCYLKAADSAATSGGKNAAEPFYKKARTSCDDVLALDEENIKGMFRRSMCWEKLGELDNAAKDIKKALSISPEDGDLKKSMDRLERLHKKQKEGQKKVFSKMFG
mmetsp:Transcript_13370/g.25246  ORF Transcript_13370/g.25246 Transcript_13370/m.25246 type:complete len:749 (+) Transcript_13370:130-2376(+)